MQLIVELDDDVAMQLLAGDVASIEEGVRRAAHFYAISPEADQILREAGRLEESEVPEL